MNKKYLIGTSAFSNVDLLKKCIDSLPKDIDNIIVFDGYNWEQVFGEFIQKYNGQYMINNDHLGCSGSWNKLIRYAFVENSYDVVIIVGSDIEMKEGYFESYVEELEEGDFDFTTARGFGFNCFAITRKCYEIVGLFDPNYYVFYYEDNDYATRVRISKLKWGDIGNPELFYHYGSASIKKNEKINKANGIIFPLNQQYYVKKWGIKDSAKMDEYSYLTPFNDPNLTIKDWTLDENLKNYKKQIWEKIVNTNN